MIRTLFIFLFSLLVTNTFASHMVGGGFRYKYISNNKYVIQLDYHKDCSANAVDYPPGAVRIGIYRKSNNTLVQSLDLNPGPISIVNFITDSCVNSPVTCVQKRVYEDTLFLNTSNFNDSTGYYLSYEQCCRNFGIKNILDPDKSGIAFYAEFVPFTKNNTNFRNSSPYLENDQNVYLCLFETFVADYKHIDPDGDSLAYKLITPVMGTTDPVFNNSNGISVLNPKPYPDINWTPGYGLSLNLMDGNPDLSIDSINGKIGIKPNQTGMYSFAYKVEEYRNGVLIASYNREVQHYVVICSVRNKPKLTWLNPTINTLRADSNTCLIFSAKDLNIEDSLNFRIAEITNNLAQQNISVEIDTTKPNDLQIKVCFDVNCDAEVNTTDSIQFIINDNSCPFILFDTLVVNLQLLPKVNQKPSILWLNPSENELKVNEISCIEIQSQDVDLNDSLIISIKNLSNILNTIEYELSTDTISSTNYISKICFKPDCNLISSDFESFKVVVSDASCPAPLIDSVEVILKTINDSELNPLENIPNVFSPNGDGINDFFSIHNNIKASCVEEFNITIYNRWGEKVYNSSNFEFKWSGEGLPYGVYFYVLRLGKEEKLGHLSIMY